MVVSFGWWNPTLPALTGSPQNPDGDGIPPNPKRQASVGGAMGLVLEFAPHRGQTLWKPIRQTDNLLRRRRGLRAGTEGPAPYGYRAVERCSDRPPLGRQASRIDEALEPS